MIGGESAGRAAAERCTAEWHRLPDKSAPWDSDGLAPALADVTRLTLGDLGEFAAAAGVRVLAGTLLNADGAAPTAFAFAAVAAVGAAMAAPPLRDEFAGYCDGQACQAAAELCVGLLRASEPPDDETPVAPLHAEAAACLNRLPLPAPAAVALGVAADAVALIAGHSSAAELGAMEERPDGGPTCSADAGLLLCLTWAASREWHDAATAAGLPAALCALCRAFPEDGIASAALQTMLLRACSLLLLVVEAGDPAAAALTAADAGREVRDRFLHRVADRSMGGSPHFGVRSLAQQARAEWLGEARGPPPRWLEDAARGGGFAVGDRVARRDAAAGDAPPDMAAPAFALLQGEVATVVDVDRDGDLRLVDPRGQVSGAFRRRKHFELSAY